MQQIGFIFQIVIIIVSIVFHELSHGYAAYFLGDPTAKYEGRLTLNPLKHMELFGSVIMPILTFWLSGMVFGWAKPVPYNPYNLHPEKYGLPQRSGELIVALAGPFANFLIAVVFSLYIRTLGAAAVSTPAGNIAILIVLVNVTLGIFNLIPIPPLDGSKILWGLLPYRFSNVKAAMERHALAFVVIAIIAALFILDPVISWVFGHLTGVTLG